MTVGNDGQTPPPLSARVRSVLPASEAWPGAVLVALAVIAVLFAPRFLDAGNVAVTTTVAQFGLTVVGLVLLHGYAGQLSLGQSGFMAVGGYASAILVGQHGWPPVAAMVVGACVAVVLAVVIGVPLLRLRGLYLALATLAFVTIVASIAVGWHSVTGGPSGQIVGFFSVGGYDFATADSLYYLSWVVLAVAIAAASNFTRSARGRAVRAIGRDELAAASMAAPVARYKLGVFVASAIVASIAGSLYTHTQNFISAEGIGPNLSLQLVVMHFLGGVTSLIGGVVGVGIIQLIPRVAPVMQKYELLIAGATLVIVLRLFPEGLVPGLAGIVRSRFRRGPAWGAREDEIVEVQTVDLGEADGAVGGAVRVENISKAFQGLSVLADVSFDVRPGTITSIVGPNGAGKTTLLNIITGVILADSGTVTFEDENITGRTPHEVARRGIARTFQTPRLYASGTALDNVMMGGLRFARSSLMSTILKLPGHRREERWLRRRALACLELVGLADSANRPAGSLPLGHQRRVEIARALAQGPRVLVLDEPAAGSNDAERKFLADLLVLLRQAGATVLLVEHTMDLVTSISDEVVVIDRGIAIGSGTPAEVQQATAVIEAYLGKTA